MLDKTKKYVVAYAHGGISNRIKCVVSALRWSAVLKRETALYWPQDHTCCCAFVDLFENKIIPINKNEYEKIKKYSRFCLIGSQYTVLDTWRLLVFRNELRRSFGKVYPKGFTEPGGGSIDFEYERIPEAIRKEFLIYFSMLLPVGYVRDQVSAFLRQFNARTVSVAIRTWNDYEKRARLFNINKFHNVMDTFPEANFFVTSDSSDAVDMLKQKYGTRIMCYPKRTKMGDRSSPEAMQDALIDLLLVSKNKFLIGSYISTFSETAWWFGGCNAKVLIARA